MKWSDPLTNERGSFSGGSIGAIFAAVVVTAVCPECTAAIAIGAGIGYAVGTTSQNLIENKPIKPLKIAEGTAIAGGTTFAVGSTIKLIASGMTPVVGVDEAGTAPPVGVDEAGTPLAAEGGSLVNTPPPESVEAGTITGPTGGEQTILVSRAGQAAPGTALSHVTLDTTLYAPGDVAGPLVDFGPGTNLYATLPEGQAALAAARWNAYPGLLEGPGSYLTSSIPEFGLPATPNDIYGANIPTENKPGWWTTVAGAAAGQTLLGGIQQVFQAGLRRFEEFIGVIPSPQEATQFARGGGGGGGGGGLKDPPGMPTWLYIVIYLTIAALIVGALMRGKRR